MAVSRVCEFCGRAIVPKSSHAVKQYYCSPECRRAAKRDQYNENRREARRAPERHWREATDEDHRGDHCVV